MSTGFYKRRRGVVEHIEAGIIDLLEDGIHDYLSLKANLVIGSDCSIPVGVVFTSAPALLPYCPPGMELRTLQRKLKHMEDIGWIKTWKIPGKLGNYPTLLCRASVHDLTGREYRINGEATKEWRNPVYEPVAEVSQSRPPVDVTLSLHREERVDNREKKNPAAKPAPPADPRFQPFVDFAYKVFEEKHGAKPSWLGKDFQNLKLLLKANASLDGQELEMRWRAYLDSSEPFTSKQGDSLAYFASHCDTFSNGPISQTKGKSNGKDTNDAVTTTIRGFVENFQRNN